MTPLQAVGLMVGCLLMMSCCVSGWVLHAAGDTLAGACISILGLLAGGTTIFSTLVVAAGPT